MKECIVLVKIAAVIMILLVATGRRVETEDAIPPFPRLREPELPNIKPNINHQSYGPKEDEALLDVTLAKIFPDGFAELSGENRALGVLKYVASVLKYQNLNTSSASEVIRKGHGICGAAGLLFETLMKRLVIPSRYVGLFGDGGSHAMSEVYYDDSWHLFDPLWSTFFYSERTFGGGYVLSLDELLLDRDAGYRLFASGNVHIGAWNDAIRNFQPVEAAPKGIATLLRYREFFRKSFPVSYSGTGSRVFPLVADLKATNILSIGKIDNSETDVLTSGANNKDHGSAFLSHSIFHLIEIEILAAPVRAYIEYSIVGKGQISVFLLRGASIIDRRTTNSLHRLDLYLSDIRAVFLVSSAEPETLRVDAIRIAQTKLLYKSMEPYHPYVIDLSKPIPWDDPDLPPAEFWILDDCGRELQTKIEGE